MSSIFPGITEQSGSDHWNTNYKNDYIEQGYPKETNSKKIGSEMNFPTLKMNVFVKFFFQNEEDVYKEIFRDFKLPKGSKSIFSDMRKNLNNFQF